MDGNASLNVESALYSIGYHPYSDLNVARDLFGIFIVLAILDLLSDPLLRQQYGRLIIFVKIILSSRMIHFARDFIQSALREEVRFPVSALFCPSLNYGLAAVDHLVSSFAIFMSLECYQSARNGRIFSIKWWLLGSSLLALVVTTLHIVLGNPIALRSCQFVPVSREVYTVTSRGQLVILILMIALNLCAMERSTSFEPIVPMSLVFFSAASVPQFMAGSFEASLPLREQLWIPFLLESRGELFSFVLLILLHLLDPRVRFLTRVDFEDKIGRKKIKPVSHRSERVSIQMFQ